jgi:hypothetical protein
VNIFVALSVQEEFCTTWNFLFRFGQSVCPQRTLAVCLQYSSCDLEGSSLATLRIKALDIFIECLCRLLRQPFVSFIFRPLCLLVPSSRNLPSMALFKTLLLIVAFAFAAFAVAVPGAADTSTDIVKRQNGSNNTLSILVSAHAKLVVINNTLCKCSYEECSLEDL